MEQQPKTYFEKLERLYVLTETRKLLKNQLAELQNNNEHYQQVEDDITKIEQELMYYANGTNIDELDFSTSSLLNPVYYTGVVDDDDLMI